MGKSSRKTALVALLSIVLSCNPVFACSWAAFANGGAAVVARTMDWDSADDFVVKGHGRNVKVKAADTENALEYVAKYASLQVHSFGGGIVAEAFNEVGLQGSILFLDGSVLPAVVPDRKDMEPGNFISYAVSTCATVQEVVDSLERINFIPSLLDIPGPDGEPIKYDMDKWPGHYAFADASGDKAVIEFIEGEVVVYHGKEFNAMTNEPRYEIHLTLDYLGYKPYGTITPVDRRSRASLYLRDMLERGVDSTDRALLAMRGLLASVNAGTEEIDRAENEVYPTLWSSLADLNNKKFYLSRYNSWCWEIYDFSMFDGEKAEAAALQAAGCPYEPVDG